MIKFQGIKNFYNGLSKFRKGVIWTTIGVGLTVGAYFGGLKPYVNSSINSVYNSIAKTPSKTSKKVTDKISKKLTGKTKKPTQKDTPGFKIVKKGDFDHNKIEDMVLKEIGTNKIQYLFGWYNPKTQGPQYLPYEILRKRLQKNSPQDVKRYDNLVARILS